MSGLKRSVRPTSLSPRTQGQGCLEWKRPRAPFFAEGSIQRHTSQRGAGATQAAIEGQGEGEQIKGKTQNVYTVWLFCSPAAPRSSLLPGGAGGGGGWVSPERTRGRMPAALTQAGRAAPGGESPSGCFYSAFRYHGDGALASRPWRP